MSDDDTMYDEDLDDDLEDEDVEDDGEEDFDDETESVRDRDVKYPDVKVRLVGEDSNAGAIIGAVTKGLRRAGYGEDVCREFRAEAMSGDYHNVIATAMRWVDVH